MNTNNRTTGRRPGFTLLELLVVIGVIAIVVAIMVPVISGARESARSAQCLTNLHQLGAAITQYTFDHDGFFPGEFYRETDLSRWPDNMRRAGLLGHIDPSFVNQPPAGMLQCPTVDAGIYTRYTNTAGAPSGRSGTDYGLNVLLVYGGASTVSDNLDFNSAYKYRLTSITRPSELVLGGDSGGWDGVNQTWGAEIIQGGGPSGYNGCCERRHLKNTTWNCVYVDGHAESCAAVPEAHQNWYPDSQ